MNKVILIDDHKMIRQGLTSFLNETEKWEVVAEADSLAGVNTLLSENNSALEGAVAIVDVKLGNDSGFDVLKAIKESRIGIKRIMYSMFDSPGYAMEAIDCGAMGYITKDAEDAELLKALDEITKGNTYIQQSMIRGITVTANLVAGLTKKEREIFDLIRQNLSNQEIAESLNISLRTTENYVSKIYDKLGINSRKDIILL